MNGSLIGLLNYPPLVGQMIFGLNVWIVRAISLLISLFFIFYHIKGWRRFILLISPIYWVLWYCYPLILGELIIWVILINLIKKKRIWIAVLILMMVLRFGFQKNSFIILDKLKPKNLLSEVDLRFRAEDSLTVKPFVPLIVRRLSYNKPFFAVKNIIKETTNFLDVETMFFGEFHPLNQKGVVIYYWFETFLLVLGVYFLLKKKTKGNINLFLVFSLIYFLISKESLFLRFGLLWYVLSKPMALSLEKVNNFWRTIFVLILLYSCGINIYNLAYRSDFWLDNKPLVFDYCFKNLPAKENVYVTQLIGNEKKYCNYYWKDKCVLNDEILKSKYICVFAGELLERKYDNKIDDNWQNRWLDKGYKVLKYQKLRDSVAFGYSDYLVIGEKQ